MPFRGQLESVNERVVITHLSCLMKMFSHAPLASDPDTQGTFCCCWPVYKDSMPLASLASALRLAPCATGGHGSLILETTILYFLALSIIQRRYDR